MTTIGIISDSPDFLNKLEKNLSLMRKNDIFLRYNFAEFNSVRSDAEIILLYSEHTNITEDFINRVKNGRNYLILFLPETKTDLILKLYDDGINDFCSPEASTAEVIVKIVNGQKYLSSLKVSEAYKNILASNGILKENNAVYKNFTNILTPRMSKTLMKTSFLAVDIPIEAREKFVDENLETRMVSALRADDIIINYKDFSYFLILGNTEFDKIKTVFEKLSNALDIKLTGMLLRYKSLKEDELLEKIENLRVIAEKEGLNFVVEEEDTSIETEKDWLDSELVTEEPQNYKFFKVMYNSKVEKVIKPVFFRMKEKYEDLLSDKRIKFLNEKNYSEFILFNGERANSLKILFTNKPYLTFQLNFSGIYAPENDEFTMPFAQLTIKNLTDTTENFIKVALQESSL